MATENQYLDEILLLGYHVWCHSNNHRWGFYWIL